MKNRKSTLDRMLTVSRFLTGVSLAALVMINTTLRNWLIIHYGILVFRYLSSFVKGFLAFQLVCVLLWSILIFRRTRKKRQTEVTTSSVNEREQILADYAKDNTNPLKVRKRLEQLRRENPRVDKLVQRCLDQMDSMDRLQARQDELIELNEALYLQETVTVLKKLEERLCENYRSIINLCIADDLASETEQDDTNKILAENDKKLEYARNLLSASAKRINRYNAGNKAGDEEILSWLKVLEDSLEEE